MLRAPVFSVRRLAPALTSVLAQTLAQTLALMFARALVGACVTGEWPAQAAVQTRTAGVAVWWTGRVAEG